MALPLALAAGVGAYQIYSGMQQADAMAAQAQDNLELAQLQAEEAAIDAYNAKVDGYSAVARYQSTIDAVMSAQRVSFAARGVDVDFGTARDLTTDTKTVGMLNTLDLAAQARAKANGYERQASLIRTQGVLNYNQGMANASATRTAAIVGGLSTGLSGYVGYKNQKDIEAFRLGLTPSANDGISPLELEPLSRYESAYLGRIGG